MPTPLREALLELVERAGWWGATEAEKVELREIFHASHAAQEELEARRQAWKPGDGPFPPGPPVERFWDGSERSRDGTPGYACYVCRDVGWVRRDRPVGDPEFGRAVPCRCRQPGGVSYATQFKARRAAAGLPPALDDATLDNFIPVAGAAKALTAAQNWRHTWERGEAGWLVLYGEPGRGKSHLLGALANIVLLTGPMVFAAVPWVLAEMAANNFAAADDWLSLLVKAPVLMLVEFGSQSTAEWARQKLELVVVERYSARRPTLFGMSCLQQDLAEWSPRVHSRLGDASLVQQVVITAGDYRLRKRKA